MLELLIATRNTNKVKELEELLSNPKIHLKDLNKLPNIMEVAETGKTFTENAVLKSTAYALQTKMWALADDSGLEVEALGGAPGIFSARYAGKLATDTERINKLLRKLDGLVGEQRRAQFTCAMVLSDDRGEIKFLAEGVCGGHIAIEAKGTNGFGYDPIFIPDGFEKTFGELADEIKQKISHRAQATRKIIRFLRSFTVRQLDQSNFRL